MKKVITFTAQEVAVILGDFIKGSGITLPRKSGTNGFFPNCTLVNEYAVGSNVGDSTDNMLSLEIVGNADIDRLDNKIRSMMR